MAIITTTTVVFPTVVFAVVFAFATPETLLPAIVVILTLTTEKGLAVTVAITITVATGARPRTVTRRHRRHLWREQTCLNQSACIVERWRVLQLVSQSATLRQGPPPRLLPRLPVVRVLQILL
jgi:hypothetical protein